MTDKVKAVPEGFHTLTPHITVRDAAVSISTRRPSAPKYLASPWSRRKDHARCSQDRRFILMLNDEFPEWGAMGPPSRE